ncbi:hypothetical protein CC80DRAFT_24710 [Byssothecium circinans]|uniref:Uncharacterized protein n=1 Tax=Byssothecium circinans TaxID=147558 RepID=A0A6A5T6B5_9PLEO|nr:hypothetical protein CC80DRAFT_24795 [Byssothecium circinans]KAF1948131.1 hypothetical protein CC80DRAFT_24710 [Byssothecium circinans]
MIPIDFSLDLEFKSAHQGAYTLGLRRADKLRILTCTARCELSSALVRIKSYGWTSLTHFSFALVKTPDQSSFPTMTTFIHHRRQLRIRGVGIGIQPYGVDLLRDSMPQLR